MRHNDISKHIICQRTALQAVLDTGANTAIAIAATLLYTLPVTLTVAVLYSTAVLVLAALGLYSDRRRSAGVYAPHGSAAPGEGDPTELRGEPGWRLLPVAVIVKCQCALIGNAHRCTATTFVAAVPAATMLEEPVRAQT